MTARNDKSHCWRERHQVPQFEGRAPHRPGDTRRKPDGNRDKVARPNSPSESGTWPRASRFTQRDGQVNKVLHFSLTSFTMHGDASYKLAPGRRMTNLLGRVVAATRGLRLRTGRKLVVCAADAAPLLEHCKENHCDPPDFIG